MAANPPHQIVDCPPSRNDGGGGGRQRREWRTNPACIRARGVALLVLAVALLITGLVFLGIYLDEQFPSKDPVFTVTITDVTGLDPELDVDPPSPADYDYYYYPPSPSPSPAAAPDDNHSSSPPPLSPVFYLTFQIDNTLNADYDACVPGLSRADVSYGDAFLAGGSVPPFCAGKKQRSDGEATAWGQNVAVPQFLRVQLAVELVAGDASVDVKVTVPTYCLRGHGCGSAVLSCKPTIGGGTSPPCRVDFL